MPLVAPAAPDSHRQVELPASKLGQALGPLARYVHAPLGHRPDGERVNPGRLGSGAFDLVTIAVKVAQEPFGHLGAGRVIGADEEDAGVGGHHITIRNL
jgi:hypothetical protein